MRLLWVHDDEFDAQPDAATWIEMVAHLQQDMEVRLLTDRRAEEIQPPGLHEKVLYFPLVRLPPYVKRLVRCYRQQDLFGSTLADLRPDAVVLDTFNGRLLRQAVAAKQGRALTLVYDVRTLPVDSSPHRRLLKTAMLARCLKYAARYLDGITYITEGMREHCLRHYRLAPHASALWSSGVNTTLFAPTSPSVEHAGEGPFRIMYHGSVSKRRHITDAVRAVALLKDLDVEFVVLGDGDGWRELEDLVVSLGLGPRVRLVGRVPYPEVPKWINRCHAGILPFQDWAGWNVSSFIKLFEYLSCARPVIVTDISAHRNVLRDSDVAFWATPGSPEDVALAIRRAYARRSDLPRLGSRARDLVLTQYTWAHQASHLSGFIRGLAGGPLRSPAQVQVAAAGTESPSRDSPRGTVPAQNPVRLPNPERG